MKQKFFSSVRALLLPDDALDSAIGEDCKHYIVARVSCWYASLWIISWSHFSLETIDCTIIIWGNICCYLTRYCDKGATLAEIHRKCSFNGSNELKLSVNLIFSDEFNLDLLWVNFLHRNIAINTCNQCWDLIFTLFYLLLNILNRFSKFVSLLSLQRLHLLCMLLYIALLMIYLLL